MSLETVVVAEKETIKTDASLKEAVEKMAIRCVNALPVSDGKRLVGLLTRQDIDARAKRPGLDPAEIRVAEVMTRDVVYCYEDQKIAEAVALLGDKEFKKLIILRREAD